MIFKRYFFLLIFFSLLFLFYPGNFLYFHLFAQNEKNFSFEKEEKTLEKKPIPFLKNPFVYPEITADGVYLLDLDSFTPLLQKNEHKKFLPASLTKIITSLVALDVYKVNDVIEVKKTINDGQLMGLVIGEKITVENLLYGLLIHSGNDAAFVLAQNYGYDKFVDLMNKKALSLGMKNTHFVNPNGLDDVNQYTTAYDLALASRVFLRNPYLKKIVSIKEIVISDVDYQYFHKLVNVNRLLGEVIGLGGLKTGYTQEAGENLISFYKKNNHQYLIIVLKSLDRFQDTKNIIEWLDENVDYLIH